MLITALGYVLAAFFAGMLAGAWWFGGRVPVAIAQPAEADPLVHEPPEPEELAQILLTDEVRQRMKEDFVNNHGLTDTDAELAIEELMESVSKLGSVPTW